METTEFDDRVTLIHNWVETIANDVVKNTLAIQDMVIWIDHCTHKIEALDKQMKTLQEILDLLENEVVSQPSPKVCV